MPSRIHPAKKSRLELNCSLRMYLFIVILISIGLSFISLRLFWNSPAHETAISIQRATENSLDSPFFLPTENSEVDFEDHILTTGELHHIYDQITQMTANIENQQHWQLPEDQLIQQFLEF
ncbi:MAG: hypothetical protein OXF49_01605 [Candidatus Saccharibacteria bacterium]|nr:hypothetical protein [Candidatus Saccharibacteria bacterium]